ncbi:MAG: hypothetical protein AAFV62_07660 [Pseudomonadota bacterium]
MSLRNDGVPVFGPVIVSVLPDGYAFDPSYPIELFAPGTTVERAEADDARPEVPSFILRGPDGAAAELDEGETVQLTFRIRRVAPPDLDIAAGTEETPSAPLTASVEIASSVRFQDGCGQIGQTRPVRTRFAARIAVLTASIEVEGEPLVSGPQARKTFALDLTNSGSEVARAPQVRLRLGGAWSRTPPRQCRRIDGLRPISGQDAPTWFLCALGADLRPGERRQARYELAVDNRLGLLDLEVRAEALAPGRGPSGGEHDSEGQSTESGSRPTPRPVIVITDLASAVAGFSIEQRVTTLAGQLVTRETPLDIGEEILLSVDATWFGIGAAPVRDVSIIQTLPEQLGFLESEQIDGEIDSETVLAPQRGRSGQVLWSLANFRGSGRFVGQVRAVVAASLTKDNVRAGEAGRDAGAQANVPRARRGRGSAAVQPGLSNATADADTVFSTIGHDFGIDPQLLSSTRAVPASLRFRSPALSLDLSMTAARQGDDGSVLVDAGERLEAVVRLANDGASAGYLDWMTLQVADGLDIVPFEQDGLDNDADGAVDEADEATVIVEVGERPLRELRWISLHGIAATPVTGGSQRLVPGEVRAWPLVLRAADDLAPNTPLAVSLQGQFGAAPFAQKGTLGRERAVSQTVLKTRPVRGFLVLSSTSYGNDLATDVAHREQLEHRLTVRFPPSALTNVVLELALPPALSAPRVLASRLGAAMRCEGIEEPQVTPAPAQGTAETDTPTGLLLQWRLGTCRAERGSQETARVAILDFGSRVTDADPSGPVAAIAAWRAASLSARLRADELVEPLVLGENTLTLTGPLLRIRRAGGGDGTTETTALRDAGDIFSDRLLVENLGDRAPSRAVLRFEPDLRGGVDCTSLRFSLDGGPRLRTSDEATSCGGLLALPVDRLGPGESAEIDINGALTGSAPVAAELALPLVVDAAAPGERPLRQAVDPFSLRTADPSLPLVEPASRVAEGAVSRAAIGDDLAVRARFAFPEGQSDVRLAVQYRALSADGGAIASAEPLVDLLAAAIARSSAALVSDRNPSGLNAAAANRAIAVGSAMAADATPARAASEGEGDAAAPGDPTDPGDPTAQASATDRGEASEPDAPEWSTLALDLGTLRTRDPKDGFRRNEFVLDITAALADVAALSEGRRVEVRAVATVDGRDFVGEAVSLARIAEPYIELATARRNGRAGVRFGEALELRGIACNRGSGPAYGVTLAVELSPGVVIDQRREPRFSRRTERVGNLALLAPLAFGEVRAEGSVVTATAPTRGAVLAPGDCAELVLPVVTRLSRDAPQTQVTFDVLGYQPRAGDSRIGRRYGGESARLVLRREALAISAPGHVVVAPGTRALYPVEIDGAALAAPVRLQAQLRGPRADAWTVLIDRNQDGVLDAGDTPFTAGETLSPGERKRMLLRVRVPETIEAGWSEGSVLVLTGLDQENAGSGGTHRARVLRAQRALTLRRVVERSGTMIADRTMALDRDCDGDLDDETTQDAVFEPQKGVALGECVVMRLDFRNGGAASVEAVNVADAIPAGTRYIPDSARFVVTPQGLVGGTIAPPERAQPVVSFDFIGSLAPGLQGRVEYRLRLVAAGR